MKIATLVATLFFAASATAQTALFDNYTASDVVVAKHATSLLQYTPSSGNGTILDIRPGVVLDVTRNKSGGPLVVINGHSFIETDIEATVAAITNGHLAGRGKLPSPGFIWNPGVLGMDVTLLGTTIYPRLKAVLLSKSKAMLVGVEFEFAGDPELLKRRFDEKWGVGKDVDPKVAGLPTLATRVYHSNDKRVMIVINKKRNGRTEVAFSDMAIYEKTIVMVNEYRAAFSSHKRAGETSKF
jgi:hypothetical protein